MKIANECALAFFVQCLLPTISFVEDSAKQAFSSHASRQHNSVHRTKFFGLSCKKIMSLDDYEVGRMSGKGKFSTVYKAKRKSDNLTVALKKNCRGCDG